jgi:hypothetical protein
VGLTSDDEELVTRRGLPGDGLALADVRAKEPISRPGASYMEESQSQLTEGIQTGNHVFREADCLERCSDCQVSAGGDSGTHRKGDSDTWKREERSQAGATRMGSGQQLRGGAGNKTHVLQWRVRYESGW